MTAPLAACESEQGTRVSSDAASEASAGATEPTDDPSADLRGPEESAAPEGSRGRGPAGGRTGQEDPAGGDKPPEVVEGGGFTTAVPGSDAPDRKVDVGPQFRISDDVDIEEIERLVKAVERIAKQQAAVQPQLTGGSVEAAVGTFSYRWFADGSVRPDPAWVAANIRTDAVPILGRVTCHRVLFPQLRGALNEIVSRGLADEIHPDEYGGCYVPRFIGREPSNGLSLHTWGIAVDLNVPGNLRGVPGEIDRGVVAIFKKWGFAWGGDWRWTDPMHFELSRLVRG